MSEVAVLASSARRNPTFTVSFPVSSRRAEGRAAGAPRPSRSPAVAPTRRPRELSPPVIDAGLARDGRPSLRASPAGGTAVRAMLADGLVDELHVLVYPLTRGSGPRSSPRTPRAKAVARGVVYLADRTEGETTASEATT